MNINKYTASRKRKITLAQRILVWVFLAIVILLIYLPIALIIVFSFTDSEYLSWHGFSFNLYLKLFNHTKIMTAVANTFIIATVSSLLSVILATFGAVGVYIWSKNPKRVFMGINQLPVINADIVISISLMLFFSTIGLDKLLNLAGQETAAYIKLIFSHLLISAPFVFLAVLPRLSSINPNLYEAALDLGAKPARALWSVLIPQLIPSMISGFLLAFTLSLDDFVVTQFNNNSKIDTISTLIYKSKTKFPPEFKALSAIIFVVIIAVLIIINIRAAQISKKARKTQKGAK